MSLIKTKAYINLPMLLRVIGYLLIIEAAFMIIPLIAGIVYQEGESLPFLISIAVTGIFGFLMLKTPVKSHEMGKREGILLTAMTWIVLSIFGMLPFLLCGTHMNVTDAFFETMSGFTTTGASVLDTLNGVPKGILMWRCVTQWIGGMGIILFTLAVLPMLNTTGGMQLFNAEVTGITHDKIRPRVSYTAKSLWLIYVALTFVLIVCLCFSQMSVYEAICHGFSIMSTGGFSTYDSSIDTWHSVYIKIVVTIFMFLGGVNFALIFKAVTGKPMALCKNEVFKTYLAFILLAYAIFAFNVWASGHAHNWQDIVVSPLFQAVSILSSTGLTEPEFSNWGPVALILLVAMMFTGACAGSTSGGAKIDRIIMLFKFIKNETYKIINPNAVTTVSINGKGNSYHVVQKVLAFLFLYMFIIVLVGMLLSVMGLPLADSLFASLSSISNTGIGTDITGHAGNFALIPDAGKWLLSLTMLTGRLEIYTVFLLFTVAFWKK